LLLFLLLPIQSAADVAPESGFLAHVCFLDADSLAPDDDTGCLVTDCTSIVRSTPRGGEAVFVLYFMRGAMGSGSLCLESLHSTLTWPFAWQLLEFRPWIQGTGTLDPNGTTHALDMYWDSPYSIGNTQGSVVPVAILRMNVIGPGRLDFTSEDGSAVIFGCGSGGQFTTYPIQVYAEAGIECGYITPRCAYQEEACEPLFFVPELVLSAPAGGSADSSVTYRAYSFHGCGFTVEPHAPWCAVWIEHEFRYDYVMHVTMDASTLPPGTYETALEVISTRGVARCLPAAFHVEATTASATMNWGRIKALYR
jgi:hypothetical protein